MMQRKLSIFLKYLKWWKRILNNFHDRKIPLFLITVGVQTRVEKIMESHKIK